jgi:hypothetical protein
MFEMEREERPPMEYGEAQLVIQTITSGILVLHAQLTDRSFVLV